MQNIITTWLWLETHALHLFQARSNMVIFLSLVKSIFRNYKNEFNSAMRTPLCPSKQTFRKAIHAIKDMVVPELVPANSFKSMIIQTLGKLTIKKSSTNPDCLGGKYTCYTVSPHKRSAKPCKKTPLFLLEHVHFMSTQLVGPSISHHRNTVVFINAPISPEIV